MKEPYSLPPQNLVSVQFSFVIHFCPHGSPDSLLRLENRDRVLHLSPSGTYGELTQIFVRRISI